MAPKADEKVRRLAAEITRTADDLGRGINIMEVCGTHTVSLRLNGVHSLLPATVRLVSGPGCPVCVTPSSYITNALKLIEEHDAVVATFGDMLKVPDADGRSLSSYMGGENLRMVYSPAELLDLARGTGRNIVFLGIGFETTIPSIAWTFAEARRAGLPNLFLYPAFKLVPPALHALLSDKTSAIDAFLLPGHVSVIIGPEAYGFLENQYSIPGVIAGFEADDMLTGILEILKLLSEGTSRVINAYPRVVKEGGNPKARRIIEETLEPARALWRGLGWIEGSGLRLRREFEELDAEKRFSLPPLENREPPGCLCPRVIQGKAIPTECGLFGARCTPENPVGPCMVSSEGACSAYLKYGEYA